MEYVFERDVTVSSGACDYSGRLSLVDTFTLFMDIATDHALMMGCGFKQMGPKNLFWLTVKTKVIFGERPFMADKVTLRTWPESPDKMRCNRSYQLEWKGEIAARGKTEWAVLNMQTGKLEPVAQFFPEDITYERPVAVPEPFCRVAGTFEDVPVYATYTVRSADIDLGGHMNNVAYVRALLGTFTVTEQKAMRISAIDAIFRNQCFEGDTLELKRRVTDDGLDICMEQGGKPMFMAHLVCDATSLVAE